MNQSPHDNIAAHGASNPWPFGCESYALTNCAIAARYLFFLTSLLHFIQLIIMYFSFDQKTILVYQVKYLKDSSPVSNNTHRECPFTGFYLMFSHFYLVYRRLQFFVFYNVYTSSDMALKITCMSVTHMCIYHWILSMSYISHFSWRI